MTIATTKTPTDWIKSPRSLRGTQNVDECGSEVYVFLFVAVMVSAAGPIMVVMFRVVLLHIFLVAVAAASMVLVMRNLGAMVRMVVLMRLRLVREVFVDLSAPPGLTEMVVRAVLAVFVVVLVLVHFGLRLALPAMRMVVLRVFVVVLVVASSAMLVMIFMVVQSLFDGVSSLLGDKFVFVRLFFGASGV